MDTSCEYDILETTDRIYGIVYMMTNTETNMRYVGQTVSHRKNKGKYRPFGAIGRYNDHVSEAVNNTKRKQCSYLNNAIRKHGKDAFRLDVLEICQCSELNTREQHHIAEKNTLYPHGYNLTKGGKTSYVETFVSDLQPTKKRGGCVNRTVETRAKMSARSKELSTHEMRESRSQHAVTQHSADKYERFNHCKIDITKLDSYIRKKGSRIVVTIGDAIASFGSKHESIERYICPSQSIYTQFM